MDMYGDLWQRSFFKATQAVMGYDIVCHHATTCPVQIFMVMAFHTSPLSSGFLRFMYFGFQWAMLTSLQLSWGFGYGCSSDVPKPAPNADQLI